MVWPKGKQRVRVPIVDRLLSHVRITETGCFIWTGSVDNKGYGQVRVDGRTVKAHRVSYETFRKPIPAGLQVCHRCDTPPCINPAHLFLGDNKENQLDSIRKGRYDVKRGARNGRAKLSDADVVEIKRRLASGESQTAIAGEFGVNRSRISAIATGRNWRHVDGEDAA